MFCSGSDISTTVQLIDVKMCTTVELRPGRIFSPVGGDIFRQRLTMSHGNVALERGVVHSIDCPHRMAVMPCHGWQFGLVVTRWPRST